MTENTPSSIARWDPFADIDLFPSWSRLGTSPALRSIRNERANVWAPAMDVAENDDRFVITMELAGANKDDVTVETDEGVLTIRGEKRSERTEENEQRRYVERSFGTFSRSFSLPSSADADSVKAAFSDGVLTVEIAKREETKPKAIAVK